MREISEIKADIARCKEKAKETGNMDAYSDAPRWRLAAACREDELRLVLTASIPLSDLETLCAAWKDGRVVVLPSKVGDTVYEVFGGRIDECAVCGWQEHKGKSFFYVDTPMQEIVQLWSNGNGDGWHERITGHSTHKQVAASDFGRTVFLTRAEAQAATDDRARG